MLVSGRVHLKKKKTCSFLGPRWWFHTFLLFSPRTLGKVSIWTNIFEMGSNHEAVLSNEVYKLWVSSMIFGG